MKISTSFPNEKWSKDVYLIIYSQVIKSTYIKPELKSLNALLISKPGNERAKFIRVE